MPRGALEKAKVATWYLTIKGAIKLHFLHRLILLINSGEKCLSKIIAWLENIYGFHGEL